MTKKHIEFYGNTGFNTIDIPQNLNVVRNGKIIASKLNYNIIQTNNLAEVIVDGLDEEEANQVDYIIISDSDNETGYLIADRGFEFKADGTCKFYIIRDSYGTTGGVESDDIELIFASANRLSVADDDETYYTELEPFRPSEKCVLIEGLEGGQAMDTSMINEYYNILETVVSPPATTNSILSDKPATITENITQINTGTSVKTNDNKEVKISTCSYSEKCTKGSKIGEGIVITKDKETNEPIANSVYCLITPQYRKLISTIINLKRLFDGGVSVVKTGTMWWNAENMESIFQDVHGNNINCEVLKDIRDTGNENGTTSYWAVNKNYIESMNDTGYNTTGEDAGGIKSITNKIYNNTAIFRTTYLPIKNNKVKYCQALTIKVFSCVSGNSLEKNAYEIRNPECNPSDDESRCDYSITADIRAAGSPIFAWKYINGEDQTASYIETIKGGSWRQMPLSAQGNYGQRQNELNFEREKKLAPFEIVGSSIISAIAAAVPGFLAGGAAGAAVAGGIALAGGLATGFASQSVKQMEQQRQLEMEGQKANIALQISSSEYLREIGKNSFYNLFVIYSNNDILSFDRFLTLYGYKVNNKTITKSDFSSRPNFNYVRCNEVILKSEKYSNRILNEVISQLKAGVRIWHELPNEQAIQNGNK